MRQAVRRRVRGTPRPGVLVVLGQVSFFVCMALGVALHPGFVLKRDEGGISNYGIHLKTVVPYSLAFLLCAGFSVAAARRYPRSGGTTGRYRTVLEVYGCLLLVTLVSTYGYTRDTGLKQAHVAVGVVMITFELVTAVWMYVQLDRRWDTVVLVVLSAGFVLAGLTFLGHLHVLFLGQALGALGFGLLLCHLGLVTPSPGR